MKRTRTGLTFSPTDLAHFLDNPYITWMDRLHLERPDAATPDETSAELEIVGDKGIVHELAFVRSLHERGRDICTIEGRSPAQVAETEAALGEGREIIYQAALASGDLSGFADFLFRVDRPSRLGAHSYEPWDTKLSRQPRPYFLIQLCAYADMLESLQGVRPERFVLVLGDGTKRPFRTDDHFFYYLHLKDAFLRQQAEFHPDRRPEPLRPGKNGRWETEAARWLEEQDHLLRVADIRTDQIQKLRAAGIATMTELAASAGRPVRRLRAETHDKLSKQARLQIASAGLSRPKHEIIPPAPADPHRGLALLPPPSPADVAFDIEGFPLIDGGLEYLLGAVHRDGAASHDGAALTFSDWWAHDDREEKRSFERFVDWVHGRWREHPDLHVYHYAAYEVTAMRRLMGKHGTRERQVDDLLRNEVFVDLYTVVHQGLRVGTPSYSLKYIEHLYLGRREADVATAGESIVFYQRWLDEPDGRTWEESRILREIRDYNEEDCRSTWMLLEWLRGVQRDAGIAYLPRPGDAEEKAKEVTPAEELSAQLLASLPEDRSADPERWRVRELLAWLLEFHWREEKPMWWRMFDRHEMAEDQLWEDLDCLAGLTRTETPPRKVKRSQAFEYRFDPGQDTKLRAGKSCYLAHDLTSCSVETMDAEAGLLEIKLGPKAMARLKGDGAGSGEADGEGDPAGGGGVPARVSLIPDEHVSAGTIAASIERTVRRYEETGELPRCAEDLLFRRRPRIAGRSAAGTAPPRTDSPPEPLIRPDRPLVDEAIDVVRNMDGTTLCIQGPPGTGKTYTGGRIILELLKQGRTVGISTNSHKAILNLMKRVADFAAEDGHELRAVKIGGDEDDPVIQATHIEHAEKIREVAGEYQLYGGTAWPFCYTEAEGLLDYLFVDEAGQVSLANLVGMAPSTRNLVLLGDQMQLGQPTQGSHPGESGKSALDYLLQDHATIPDDLGIFLATTWRMHPAVCSFISDAVYEGRLLPEEHTARRVIVPVEGGRIRREAGLLFVPVEHEGNTQGSDEEVAAVQDLVRELLRCGHTDKTGADAGRLTLNDILVVAPYNLQVRMLKQALGDEARVGTIDKFQGQEAPVVIVSMAASAGDSSPRGIDFLFDKNRLNVAISRAQSLAIVVAHPDLVRTPCSSVKQVELVNLFGRIAVEGDSGAIPEAAER